MIKTTDRTLHTPDLVASITPEVALQHLKDGNRRFLASLSEHHDLLRQVNAPRDGQSPFATVLTCIDSRTSAELIFDQGLGDIFCVRMAGTVVTDAVLGSLELACEVAGSRLVVILGHTRCGAIQGACDGLLMGNLTTLLNRLQPSVREGRGTLAPGGDLADHVSEVQARRAVEMIYEQSAVLRSRVERQELALVAAMYDISTGCVQWLDQVSRSHDAPSGADSNDA